MAGSSAACILSSNPPDFSAEVLKLAVAVIEDQRPAEKTVLYRAP